VTLSEVAYAVSGSSANGLGKSWGMFFSVC